MGDPDAADGADKAGVQARKYDGYEAQTLPAIRNQGNEGACWAFASIGAVESDLIADQKADRTKIDLSELQLAYFSSHNFTDPKNCHVGDTAQYKGKESYLSNGGNAVIAYHYLANMVGAVEEKYVPYRLGNSYTPDEKYAVSSNFAQLKNAYVINTNDIEGIQAAIKKHGGVAASFFATTGSWTLTDSEGNTTNCSVQYSATYNSMYGTRPETNHAVMLVGWDDDFPKEHFHEGCQPEANGAWLVRNSWGLEDYGKRGYFWLSYYDKGLARRGYVVAYDADTSMYDNCYSYELQPIATAYYSGSSVDSWTVRQTYSVSGGEMVSAVGFETADANLNIGIEVTDGLGHTAYGVCATTYPGYYTAELTDGFAATDGKDVTVSITYNGQPGVQVPLEAVGTYNTNNVYFTGVCDSGGCIINNRLRENYDARMKLFTMNGESQGGSIRLALKKNSVSGHAGEKYQLELDPENTSTVISIDDLTWTSTDEGVATVDSDGLITVGKMKGTAAVIGSCTVSGKTYTAECEVTVLPYNITYGCSEDTSIKIPYPVYEYYPGDNDNCSLPEAYRQGYELDGWYSDPSLSDNKEITVFDLQEGSTNLTLYPKWKERPLNLMYYVPTADLSGYTTTDVPITHTRYVSEFPIALPNDPAACYTNHLSAKVSGYNSDHPDAPKHFSYWSWDEAGVKPVDIITADSGYAMKMYRNAGDGRVYYNQSYEIHLYPQFGDGSDIVEGKCGESLYYKVTGTVEDGYTLEITGTGPMYSTYTSGSSYPWYRYRNNIKAVVLNEGITGITGYAFCEFTKISQISFPSTLSSIGGYFLYGCTGITELTLPSGLTSVDPYALYELSALKKVINNSDINVELPPVLDQHWIDSYDGTRTPIEKIASSTALLVYEFRIKFSANGGTGQMDDQFCTIGVEVPLTECAFSNAGYTFAGWNTKSDGSGTSYTAEQRVKNLASDGSTIYLYAQWTASEYTVTFAPGTNATVSPTSKTVTYGQSYGYDEQTETVGDLPTPSYADHSFLGWYTAASGGSPVTSATKVTRAVDHTLYAHWATGTVYTVTFDSNYENGPVQKLKVVSGSAIGELPSAERTGYQFDGWFTESAGGTNISIKGMNISSDLVVDSNVTYYAHWTANTYTVTFDPNGGTVTPVSKNVTYGEKYGDLPEPVLTGYNFLGWFADLGAGTAVTAESDYLTDGNTVLFAKWSAIHVTGVSLDITTKTITVGDTFALTATVEPAAAADKSVSWSSSKPGFAVVDTLGQVTGVAAGETAAGETDITVTTTDGGFTAVCHVTVEAAPEQTQILDRGQCGETLYWEIKESDVENGYLLTITGTGEMYDFQENTVPWRNYSAGITELSLCSGMTKVGNYAFSGFESMTEVTFPEGVKIFGSYIFNNTTAITSVVFPSTTTTVAAAALNKCEGLQKIKNLSQASITAPSFLGSHWIESGGTTRNEITSVVNMTAERVSEYTISYTGNGSTSGEDFTMLYTMGINYQYPESPFLKTGYTFAGWKDTSGELGIVQSGSSFVSVTDDKGQVTMEAQWTPNEYTVTFEPSGGTVDPASKQVTYDAAYGELPVPVRNGYGFTGWYLQNIEDQDHLRTAGSVLDIADDFTLYAFWLGDAHTLTLDLGYGNAADRRSDVTVRNGEKWGDHLTTPTRPGCVFNGWYTAATGGTAVDPEEVIAVNDNIVFYAVWTPNVYTMTFDANGGAVDEQSRRYAYLSDVGELPVPSKAKHSFDGWFLGEDRIDNGAVYEYPRDITVTAHWSPIHVSRVSLDRTRESIYTGDSFTLTATVTPSNALDRSVTWTSSDPTIVSVDNSGKVTGLKAGNANVTVRSVDGGKSAVCRVKVESMPEIEPGPAPAPQPQPTPAPQPQPNPQPQPEPEPEPQPTPEPEPGPVSVPAESKVVVLPAEDISAQGIAEEIPDDTVTLRLKIGEAAVIPEYDTAAYTNFIAFDMKLIRTKNGVSSEVSDLTGEIEITLPVPAGMEAGRIVVLHYKKDGTCETIVPTVIEGGAQIRFRVSGFSTFALAQKATGNKERDSGSRVKAFVARMYSCVLSRMAENIGLNDWSEQLVNGDIDGAGIARGFFESNEFVNKNVPDDEYVSILYHTFFNREADEGGKAYWTGKLAGGATRRSVLAGFVNSEEFRNLCKDYGISRGTLSESGGSVKTVNMVKIRNYVMRMYEKALGRAGDEAGIEYWVNAIAKGEKDAADVAKIGFFESKEYHEKNRTDEEFIYDMYQAFFDRDPDAAGKAYWLDKLAKGEKRAEIIKGFGGSNEFGAILKSFGLR